MGVTRSIEADMQVGKDTLIGNPEMLMKLVRMRMPFGRYRGRLLCELPEPYVAWFHRKGFPPGEIGTLLSLLFEIRLNGLEYLLKPIRNAETNGSTTGTGEPLPG